MIRSSPVLGVVCVATMLSLLTIPTMPGAQARGASHVVYVALGDSYTFGTGANNPSKDSYPAQLARHLPSGSRFLNLGVPGYTAADAVQAELPQALAAHPTVATVWLGTNDILQGVNPGEFEAGLDRILKALHGAHTRVFVATLPDFAIVPITVGDSAFNKAGRASNATIVKLAARYGDPVIDVYSASRSLWGRSARTSADSIHLTTAGYAALATVFYRVMHAHGALSESLAILGETAGRISYNHS